MQPNRRVHSVSSLSLSLSQETSGSYMYRGRNLAARLSKRPWWGSPVDAGKSSPH
jgi:hypothetical protein